MRIVTFYSLHFFILIFSLEIHFAMINNKNKLLMTSIIAMTFLIGFTANEVYAGAGGGSCGVEACTDTLQVNIDIKPGSFPNSINTNSMGVVPVAILTTANFDASTVDPSTLIFMAMADTGFSEDTNCDRHGLEDVDGDGDLDLVCKFPQKTTGINCETTEGVIYGQTKGGQAIRGFDSINPVGKECNNNNGD